MHLVRVELENLFREKIKYFPKYDKTIKQTA